MPIDQTSPLWSVLADWLKVVLTLPDPPPDSLAQLNDVAIMTAISVLTERLSPNAAPGLQKVMPSIMEPFTRPKNPQPAPAPQSPGGTPPQSPGPILNDLTSLLDNVLDKRR
jgi:hypothetical protein